MFKVKTVFLALVASIATGFAFATLPKVASQVPQALTDAVADRQNVFGDVVWLPPQTSEETSEQAEKIYDNYVETVNLCWYSAGDEPQVLTINYSSYRVDASKYVGKTLPFCVADYAKPTVLILHTHGSESYLASGCSGYNDDATFRSTNGDDGVVAVGREMARVLRQNGIGVIHDETMYDLEDFNTSYTRSNKAVQDWLLQYPSIVCVIDLHRDSIFTSDGQNQKPIVTLSGQDTAQIMLVVGTDETGSGHPNWQQNLTFAANLQSTLNELYPMLARPVNIRDWPFNQMLCTGYLLVEVGSCGNTLQEALNAATCLGNALTSLLMK